MVKMILELNEKNNRIVNLVKANKNFKNKNQAINFIIDYGSKYGSVIEVRKSDLI